jgi:hypothetical protein
MNRRNFIISAAAAGSVSVSPAAPSSKKNAIFELRYFRLRNGNQVPRTHDFLAKAFVPAARRAGIGPHGFFSGVVAAESPFVLSLLSYASLGAMDEAAARLAADKEFNAAFDDYNSGAEPPYARMESSLLRAFDSIPEVEVPPGEANRPPRIFELRTYESNTVKASQRKIKMFDDAEIAIFRRCGLLPVFFGSTFVGRNLPNLTYLVGFDNFAARDKAWNKFRADPEWQKLRVTPGLTDPEIVSNISSSILAPLPFSAIR